MANWIYILVSVAVAAFVGGITNHFAIKMLFHPRKPIHIGKFHVPFTPGLIPKRRDDIAVSLGNVVAEYLVTPEGLQEVLHRPSIRQKAAEYADIQFQRICDSSLTIKEAGLKLWSEEEWESVRARVAQFVRQLAQQGTAAAWKKFDMDQLQLRSVVPGWSEHNTAKWSGAAADALLTAIEEELLSAEGQRLLTKAASGMMDQAGGFLGAMAAIFVDEDKMVRKVTPALIRALRSEATRDRIVQAIQSRLLEYGDKPVAELFEGLTGGTMEEWMAGKVESMPIEKWLMYAEQVKISAMLAPWRQQVVELIPNWSNRILMLAASGVPVMMRTIELPELVRQQVEKFPIEQLEDIILNISGKEFRAITWLGVVLGGFIGLMQALFMLWWR